MSEHYVSRFPVSCSDLLEPEELLSSVFLCSAFAEDKTYFLEVVDAQLSATDQQRFITACICVWLTPSQAVHAVVLHSHIIWWLPPAMLALTQPTTWFKQCSITPTQSSLERAHLKKHIPFILLCLSVVIIYGAAVLHCEEVLLITGMNRAIVLMTENDMHVSL